MKKLILAAALSLTAIGASAQVVSCPPGGPLSWMPSWIKVQAPAYDINHRYRRFSVEIAYDRTQMERINRLSYSTNVMLNNRGQRVLIDYTKPETQPMAVGIRFADMHDPATQWPYFHGVEYSWASSLPWPHLEYRQHGFAIFSGKAIEIEAGQPYRIAGRFAYTNATGNRQGAAVFPPMGYGAVQVLGVIGRRNPETGAQYNIHDCEGINNVPFWGPRDVVFPDACRLATYGFTSAELQASVRSPFSPRPTTKAGSSTGLIDAIMGGTLHTRTPLTGEPSHAPC